MNKRRSIIISSLAVCLVASSLCQVFGEDWSRSAFVGKWEKDSAVRRHLAIARTNTTYVDALAEMRTDESQAALLLIAYGEFGDWGASQAAGRWARNLTNRSNARALLVSRNLDVQRVGFSKLCGQPLDESLFAQAATAITNNSLDLRVIITHLFSGDTNMALAERKTALIAGSMKTTLVCRDAKQTINITTEAIFEKDWVPWGELGLSQQACLLGRTKGVTAQMISDALGSEQGLVGDFAVIAKAYTDEAAARLDLYRLLTNSPTMTVRYTALTFLYQTLQPSDEPILKWVAANDPFKSKPTFRYFMMHGADRSLEGKKDAVIYPLRIWAEQCLTRLRNEKKK